MSDILKDRNNLYSVKMRASLNNRHISGAEGIFIRERVDPVVRRYISRAISHSKGCPDSINLSIRELKEDPQYISSLPVVTVNNKGPVSARNFIWEVLCDLGVAQTSIKEALRIIYNDESMRGAALLGMEGAERLEPDRERGVRVSSIGITENAESLLRRQLTEISGAVDTVLEALVLASKVANNSSIIAELCISDDPDYTTGYISSTEYGYVRIPNIKCAGTDEGGRVFFLEDNVDIVSIIDYLEKVPVMISDVSNICEVISQNEFISSITG